MNRAEMLLLDILWPNRCDCCDTRIPYDLLLCTECTAQLDDLCAAYETWLQSNPEPNWDGGAVLFTYEGAARAGVLSMKDGRRGFGRFCAKLLAEQLAALCPPEEISFLTWVPVTKVRRRMQGYAHAEFLGRQIAAELHMAVRGDLITEHAGKLRQHDLSAKDRAAYANRFQHTGKNLQGQTILLVDDILTTGSTLRRCTELLKSCGAARVYIAAVCATLKKQNILSNK